MGALVHCSTVHYAIIQASSKKDHPKSLVIAYPDENCLRDYDVRTAFLNLQAATEQVGVARQNVDLANENLSRSKERSAAGVTDSVEGVQAQQSLASAND